MVKAGLAGSKAGSRRRRLARTMKHGKSQSDPRLGLHTSNLPRFRIGAHTTRLHQHAKRAVQLLAGQLQRRLRPKLFCSSCFFVEPRAVNKSLESDWRARGYLAMATADRSPFPSPSLIWTYFRKRVGQSCPAPGLTAGVIRIRARSNAIGSPIPKFFFQCREESIRAA